MLRKKNCRGFSLIELLIVCVIIGILVTIALAKLQKTAERAKIAAAKGDIKTFVTALEVFHHDTSQYPETASKLGGTSSNSGLVTMGSDIGTAEGWRGPYVDVTVEVDGSITDPWRQAYVYTHIPASGGNLETYDLHSKGPDKTDSTADDISWPFERP